MYYLFTKLKKISHRKIQISSFSWNLDNLAVQIVFPGGVSWLEFSSGSSDEAWCGHSPPSRLMDSLQGRKCQLLIIVFSQQAYFSHHMSAAQPCRPPLILGLLIGKCYTPLTQISSCVRHTIQGTLDPGLPPLAWQELLSLIAAWLWMYASLFRISHKWHVCKFELCQKTE